VAIYKRGDTWWYEFVFSGERIRESTKQGNKRVAEQMAAARRTQLAKGEVGIKDRPPAPTVREYAEKSFLPHVRARKGKKPKTLAFYENSVKNLLGFDKLATAKLDQVDVPLIDLFISRRRAMNLQVSTINRELATLRRMFNLLRLRTEAGRGLRVEVALHPERQRRELRREDSTGAALDPSDAKNYGDAREAFCHCHLRVDFCGAHEIRAY
jgi:Phage integrase, N-terminal SAM-like domain